MAKHFLALCVCIVTAYGCQSTSQSTSQSLPTKTVDTKVSEIPQYRAPSGAYSALSQRYSSAQAKRDVSILRRTKSAIDRGDLRAAQTLISGGVLPPSDTALADVYQRLMVQIQTRREQPKLAVQSLLNLQSMVIEDVETTRQVCAQIDAIACVVRALITQQLLAGQLDSITEQTRIWATLQSSTTLPQDFDPSNTPAILQLMTRISEIIQRSDAARLVANTSRNWIDLHHAITRAGTPGEALALWQSWQDRHPDHPAVRTPPPSLKLLAQYEAPSMTVALPLSGRLAGAGKAVRDGMVAGYLSEQDPTRAAPVNAKSLSVSTAAATSVSFIDSNAIDDASLLTQIVESESDVIVGPLLKERGQRLLANRASSPLARSQEQASPAWIVLNRIDESGPAQSTSTMGPVYQFAPTIEDEAQTIAKHLRAREYERLMVVTNRESWAYRATQALTSSWRGAIVLADFERPREITGTVGAAMGVGDSQGRHGDLQRVLNKEIEFLPRGREDLDAVVAFTSALESKALVPALQFHFADKLPVFATSQSARSENLSDIAGFHVTELPLLANPDPVAATMSAVFDLREQPLVELYALGLDAYRLAAWVHWIQTHANHWDEGFRLRLNLASGQLVLGRNGQIERELALAEISSRGTLSLSQTNGG